jgi:hypothetical protein
MKILIIVLSLILFAPFASADSGIVSGITGFFSYVMEFFDNIKIFIFETIPNAMTNFFIWISSWYLKMKFMSIYYSLQFSHSVATTFMDMINITTFVNSAISALPQDMKQLAADVRFFDALTLVVEAWITKLVYGGFSD